MRDNTLWYFADYMAALGIGAVGFVLWALWPQLAPPLIQSLVATWRDFTIGLWALYIFLHDLSTLLQVLLCCSILGAGYTAWLVRRFNNSGVTSIEYALIAAGVAVVALASVQMYGQRLSCSYYNTASQVPGGDSGPCPASPVVPVSLGPSGAGWPITPGSQYAFSAGGPPGEYQCGSAGFGTGCNTPTCGAGIYCNPVSYSACPMAIGAPSPQCVNLGSVAECLAGINPGYGQQAGCGGT